MSNDIIKWDIDGMSIVFYDGEDHYLDEVDLEFLAEMYIEMYLKGKKGDN